MQLLLRYFLLVLLLNFSCTGAKEDTDDFSSPRNLYVDYISSFTSGIVSSQTKITVKLAQKINYAIPGDKINEKIFAFEPAIKGAAYWEDENTVVFEPEEKLADDTEYKAHFFLHKLLKTTEDRGEFRFLFRVMKQNFELIWGKIYIQDRFRFDGADIHHIILKTGEYMKWDRLLWRMEQHWHLLLSHLLTFQFVYPSERDKIRRPVFDELLDRAKKQFDIPPSKNKVCLGPIIDHSNYEIDITEWGFKALTLKTI